MKKQLKGIEKTTKEAILQIMYSSFKEETEPNQKTQVKEEAQNLSLNKVSIPPIYINARLLNVNISIPTHIPFTILPPLPQSKLIKRITSLRFKKEIPNISLPLSKLRPMKIAYKRVSLNSKVPDKKRCPLPRLNVKRRTLTKTREVRTINKVIRVSSHEFGMLNPPKVSKIQSSKISININIHAQEDTHFPRSLIFPKIKIPLIKAITFFEITKTLPYSQQKLSKVSSLALPRIFVTPLSSQGTIILRISKLSLLPTLNSLFPQITPIDASTLSIGILKINSSILRGNDGFPFPSLTIKRMPIISDFNILKEILYAKSIGIYPKVALKSWKYLPVLQFSSNVAELLDIGGFIVEEAKKMKEKALLEELFRVKEGAFPKGASEVLEKPILILMFDKYENELHIPLAYVCAELYKEIKGGETPIPAYRDFDKPEQVDSTQDVSLLFPFKFTKRVEIIDGRIAEHVSIQMFLRTVRGRIKTAYLQGLGFLIINFGDPRRLKDRYFSSTLQEIKNESKGAHIIKIINNINDPILKKAIIYGVLGIKNPSDLDFKSMLEKYHKSLRDTVKVLSIFVPMGESVNGRHQFRETLHYPMKVATFSYFVNRELEKLEKKPLSEDEFYQFIAGLLRNGTIKIETPIKEGIIPDMVYEGDNRVIIEIETLIGTGDPLKKIDKTVSKYLSDEGRYLFPDYEFWIILRPVSALIHYEEIFRRAKIYNTIYEELNPSFKVLTLEFDKKNRLKWHLVDIEDFGKEIKKALNRIKEIET
ncbi:hypothetical protein [Pyrococcus sp. ST04]|uniref:hypothetical protein n=1 Tax=Pyrococcus sp. ST04 TaxID=1183377 RepID=UPI0002605DD2|nr:hypothetical protein [Pyrococcus sp. ST04]AFK23137.1 hypothetical protein Py04_1566 [Pyrococcus sp. ST04]